MKKGNVRTLDGIIYSLFIFMTIVTLFIIYRDIPSNAVLNFVTAYAIFAILIPLYILVRVLLPDLKLSKMLPSSLGFAFGITCFDIVLSKRTK